MFETVSVDEAIAKGHRMVNYPAIIIMFAVIGISFYLGIQKILPEWSIAVGFVLGIGLAWLYWSVVITKWRLWAFDNVRNVHELKKRAIKEKLIWPDNSVFEKTELRNSTEKEKWKSLQAKFEKDDLFIDDLTVPNETIVYYSKGGNYLEMAVMLGCMTFGLYLFIKEKNYFIGPIFSIVGAYLAFKEYKQATNRNPQIIISEKGIKTSSTEFYEWPNIIGEEVVKEGSGKNTRYYLTYIHPTGSEHLQIDDFDTDPKSLNKLLALYRGRNTKKSNHR